MRIVYLISIYVCVSDIFICNEVLELCCCGYEVYIFLICCEVGDVVVSVDVKSEQVSIDYILENGLLCLFGVVLMILL